MNSIKNLSDLCGARGRIWTTDTRIFSPLLYPWATRARVRNNLEADAYLGDHGKTVQNISMIFCPKHTKIKNDPLISI